MNPKTLKERLRTLSQRPSERLAAEAARVVGRGEGYAEGWRDGSERRMLAAVKQQVTRETR